MRGLRSNICLCLLCLLTPSCGAADACNWAEWSCLKVEEARCYAYRRRECQGRREDQFLTSRDEQVSAGTLCFREGSDGQGGGCRSEPLHDSARLPAPGWCPWTAWSQWRLECRALLEHLPQLAELISLANDSSGFAYATRTRGCYCPASADPSSLACPGPREQWRAVQLSELPRRLPGRGVCQWCSWGAWQPNCACDGPGSTPGETTSQPVPTRRRACLCSDGSLVINASAAGSCDALDGVADVETAASVEAVCPACSRGLREESADGYYRAASFLNPLAIGFAVYLLAALAAFLVCRLFCGDPRQSDANSRDQLSVDDFLTTPAAAATSAV